MTPKTKRMTLAATLAMAIAVPAEGLRQWWYLDPPGIVTVCYGHTGDVDKTRKYSLEECGHLLNKDMLHAIEQVEKCHPGLPEPILAAFGDAAYNLGPKVACGPGSTASRMLSSNDYVGACNQLKRWNKARLPTGQYVELPGLTKRREKERQLCLTGAQ